jgi:hypothetical protein
MSAPFTETLVPQDTLRRKIPFQDRYLAVIWVFDPDSQDLGSAAESGESLPVGKSPPKLTDLLEKIESP